MKLTDSNKIAIALLVGIGVCLLLGLYVVKPNIEDRQLLEADCDQLQIRLNELQEKQANREFYETGIVENEEKYQEILNSFPADLNQEISIMFLENIKDTNEFNIESLGLDEKVPFYTLGSNGADANLAATGTDSTTGTTEQATTETATTEAAASDTQTALVEDGALEDEDALVCYSAAFPITYYGSYKSLKDVVSYIDSYSDRMTVDTLEISYDGENKYSGSLDLTCYSIEGASRPERSIDLEQVEIGVDNIFIGGNATSGSATSTLNKYDENDGSAIETNYDFYAMLNPATSDVSAKVVGQNGTGKENTVLSASDNSLSSIVYDIYTVDGKNYCKYTVDNDQSYEAEITSADDMKLLIQSSERKNDDDKVAVQIQINNATSLPVYIKVTGDDAVNPRVRITKTGLVKVYQ